MSYQAQKPRGGGVPSTNRNKRNKNQRVKQPASELDNGNEPLEETTRASDEFNSLGSEDDVEEPASVVNASLIVNLSNANVSNVSFAEQQRGDEDVLTVSGGDDGEDNDSKNESSCTVVPASPLEEQVPFPNSSSGEDEKMAHSIAADEQRGGVEESTYEQVVAPASSSSGFSEEASKLADSEVEKLMSSGGAGGGVSGEVVLPSTVTLLKAPNGCHVYLVGTAHFSHQSQVDVVQTIQRTNPTLVLLELCSSRRNILNLDEETVLKEISEMNFQKVRLALSNSGAVQGVLHLLLLSMSAQLTRKLGMAPGGEFRAAMREARKIPGCVLLLGDRPFNITISRALAALSFFQKIKLAWQFITSNEDITKEEIEKCKELDAISMLLKEMTGEFPSITEVFVNERDVFLAHSLLLAATSEAHGAGERDRVVVGVVGMGHVPGIVKNWTQTTDESVNELLRIPETPISTIIIRKTIKLCWYGLLGYGVYRIAKRAGGSRSIEIIGKTIGDQIGAVKLMFKV